MNEPKTLREQLFAESLARAGAFKDVESRLQHDALFEQIWQAARADATEVLFEIQDDLRAARAENERLKRQLGRVTEAARDAHVALGTALGVAER